MRHDPDCAETGDEREARGIKNAPLQALINKNISRYALFVKPNHPSASHSA